MNAETINTAFAAVRLYAETHPRPLHVTQQQATDMLGCGITKERSMVRGGTLQPSWRQAEEKKKFSIFHGLIHGQKCLEYIS